MLDATGALAAAPAFRADSPEVPWLAEAHRMMEAGPSGLRDRRDLLHLLGRVNRRTPWTIPWCGLFVAHCLRTAYPAMPLPSLPARARPWRRWGREADPQIGALMLFWHYHPALPFGHVAFYWGEDHDAYHVLGGNQGHRVCVQRYPKERFVTARWPEGVPQNGVTRPRPEGAARPFAA